MNTTHIPTGHRETVQRLFKDGGELMALTTATDFNRLHAAVGMAGEAGELELALLEMRQNDDIVSDTQPRWWGIAFDMGNVIEELGDYLFYEAALRIHTDLEALDVDVHKMVLSRDVWYHDLHPVKAIRAMGERKVLLDLVSALSAVTADILDIVKKSVMYNQELDRGRLKQRLYDECWLLIYIGRTIGKTEAELRGDNIDKLERGKDGKPPRYKDGYSDEAAAARADKADDDKNTCELCDEPRGFRTGCSSCGRMVGDCCLAAESDLHEEPVCEECF